MNLPTSVHGVIANMRQIDADLPAGDGVAVFNRMYLTVTQRVAALLAERGTAAGSAAAPDPSLLADLDVRFAGLWLSAVEAGTTGQPIPTVWQPLFAARQGGCEPIQYAIAGMNSHIEHDLPVAVVATCTARGIDLDAIESDYLAINGLLADIEAPIRESFLDHAELRAEDHVEPVVHVLSTWSIDAAREVAWGTARTLWALRDMGPLRDGFLDGLARTVAMTSRALLVPTTQPLASPGPGPGPGPGLS